MNINRDKATYIAPFSVLIFDATDAYYYADIMEDKMEVFTLVDTLKEAITLADALFVIKNYKWTSLQEMNECDGGYDIRVFDSSLQCVYAAHERFKQQWMW